MSARPLFKPEQVERLLRPIRPGRVYVQQGHSHVAGWDVAAHLTRMFGFGGWEKELRSIELVLEEPRENPAKNGKNAWTGWNVTYRCVMQLRVFIDGELAWRNEDAATGSAQNQPNLGDAHDLAYKNAVTYALKRCAKDLGDQFGLSLYNKGSEQAVVGMTLVGTGPVDESFGPHDPEVEVRGDTTAVGGVPCPACGHPDLHEYLDDGNGRDGFLCTAAGCDCDGEDPGRPFGEDGR